MLLCYDQHRVIDNASMWDIYDANTLRQMKRQHEHRIRELTALQDEDRSTVIRVVGSLHGAGVELSRQSVAKALLHDGKFPHYALLGPNEFEIDLRGLAGEPNSTSAYWDMGRDMITQRLRLLNDHIRTESVRHISVFALTRIPFLISLGSLLDDTVPTDVYARRRDDGEGWGWTSAAPDTNFRFHTLRSDRRNKPIAVLFSVSGQIDPARLPEAAYGRVYELLPEDGTTPNPDAIRTKMSLDNFTRTWRQLLAEIEANHLGLSSFDVFAAVPVTAAVSIGRALMKAAHPRLRVYDRIAGTRDYQFALEVGT